MESISEETIDRRITINIDRQWTIREFNDDLRNITSFTQKLQDLHNNSLAAC